MKKTLAMALLPLLAAGCGSAKDENNDGIADGVQTPGSVSVVAPSTPMGTVSGQVLNSKFQPLEGVDVTVTVGSAPAGLKGTSDVAGNFAIKDVPAGASVLLTFSKGGYATYRSTATVPSTAGNVPINNGNASFGPVVMGDTSGNVKFYVYTPMGRPATGATATLSVNPASYLVSRTSENISNQPLVVQGTVDANGVLTFNGVPSAEEGIRIGSNYTVYISPMDTNSDGIPDVDGSVNQYDGNTLLTGGLGNVGVYAATTIQLQTAVPTTGLDVKYSNLAAIQTGDLRPLHNMVRLGDPISIAFNQPIQPGSLVVTLTDEYGKEPLSVTKTLNSTNTYLSITPGSGVLSEGKEYNLYVRAVALSDGSIKTSVVPFFVGNPASPPALSVENLRVMENAGGNSMLDVNEYLLINFNQVVTYLNNGQVQLFFDADLNGDGDKLDFGEKDGTSGFPLLMWEPTQPSNAQSAVFGLRNSGYTTRFYIQYTGARQFNPALLPTATLKFSTTIPTSEVHYQSGWGIPQQTDLTLPTAATVINP